MSSVNIAHLLAVRHSPVLRPDFTARFILAVLLGCQKPQGASRFQSLRRLLHRLSALHRRVSGAARGCSGSTVRRMLHGRAALASGAPGEGKHAGAAFRTEGGAGFALD